MRIRRVELGGAVVAGALALLAGVAAIVPAHAETDALYGGLTDGAGVPVRPDANADPGSQPGSAALAAQAERFDPQVVYGGLRVSEAVAVEAVQRRPFGDASKSGDEFLGLAGKARLPVTDALSVTGTLGVRFSGSMLAASGPAPGESSGANPVYGLGLAYETGQRLELSVATEHVAARGEPKAAGGDSVVLGARLRF